MSENHKQKLRGIPLRVSTRFLCGTLISGVLGSTAYAASEFTPRLELYASWTDNVSLLADDDPLKEDAYIIQANPGFLWTQKSQRYELSLEYLMQNLFYLNDSDRNSTYHQGNFTGTASVVREYFFLEGTATYSQQIIDPELPAHGSNLFLTNNTADALAAQITPILSHEFDLFFIDARYSRGIVDYKQHKDGGNADALQDADHESTTAYVSNVENKDLRLTWKAFYSSQTARYDNAPDFKYDEANAELGFLVGNNFRLIGRYGLESDPSLDQTKGGLDSEYWEAGFQWRPGIHTNVEAYYGERFFGPTYKAIVEHEAQRVVVSASYSEGPSTQAQELANQPQSFGAVIPGQNYFARPTSDAFVHKTLDGSIHIKGSRTDITIGLTDYKREYLNTSLNAEHTKGASLDFSRALSSRSRFEIGGSFSDTDLRDGQQYRDADFRIELNRQVSERVRAALTGHRIERSGDFNYDANVVSVSLIGEF